MMTDEEFEAFAAQSIEQLRHKQTHLTESGGIGRYADFWFDQETGTIQFKESCGHVGLEATIIPIGSLSATNQKWQWAWANESLTPRLREKAERVKGLFELTGRDIFHKPMFEADEPMAWEVTALAVRYLESLGAYRMPVGQLLIFLAIGTIGPPDKLSKSS